MKAFFKWLSLLCDLGMIVALLAAVTLSMVSMVRERQSFIQPIAALALLSAFVRTRRSEDYP